MCVSLTSAEFCERGGGGRSREEGGSLPCENEAAQPDRLWRKRPFASLQLRTWPLATCLHFFPSLPDMAKIRWLDPPLSPVKNVLSGGEAFFARISEGVLRPEGRSPAPLSSRGLFRRPPRSLGRRGGEGSATLSARKNAQNSIKDRGGEGRGRQRVNVRATKRERVSAEGSRKSADNVNSCSYILSMS